MNSIINLGIWQVALAYIFVLNLIAIVRLRGIKREKQILISSIRMTCSLSSPDICSSTYLTTQALLSQPASSSLWKRSQSLRFFENSKGAFHAR